MGPAVVQPPAGGGPPAIRHRPRRPGRELPRLDRSPAVELPCRVAVWRPLPSGLLQRVEPSGAEQRPGQVQQRGQDIGAAIGADPPAPTCCTRCCVSPARSSVPTGASRCEPTSKAALVLFISLGCLLLDSGVEQRDGVATGRQHDRGGPVDADPGAASPRPLPEGINLNHTFSDRRQLGHHPPSILGRLRQRERSCRPGQDWIARLDDAMGSAAM
jgi:hypothetical protein